MSEEVSSEVSEPIVDSTSEEANAEVDVSSEEVSEEGAESTEEVAETEAEESDEVQEEPTYEMVVNGEKLNLTISEMTELAQKGEGAARKFQEAAKLRKEAAAEKAAIQAAMNGSPQALFDLKIKSGQMTVDEMRQWVIQEAIKIADEPELTEEQRKMREMEAELEQYRKEQEDAKKANEEAAFQEEVERYKEEYSAKLTEAIKAGGLENDPTAVRRVAMAIQDSLDENGNPMMEMEDAIAYVKSEERNSYKDFLAGLELDQLEQILGQEKMTKLRKTDLSKLANPESVQKEAPKETAPKKVGSREGSLKDFLESL